MDLVSRSEVVLTDVASVETMRGVAPAEIYLGMCRICDNREGELSRTITIPRGKNIVC